MYTAIDIKNILSSTIPLVKENTAIQYLVTDSRKIASPASSLFFAIKTSNRDGHLFIEEAYKKGVRNFVVDDFFSFASLADANFFSVKNVVAALQLIAKEHRQHFSLPIIGITGSNGKTIVKEWLHHLLQDNFNIVRSPRSYNSQIGVPLSIWQINQTHQLGIFEAGISTIHEMDTLATIIAPSIGILTSVGEAHQEGFKSIEEKIKEKLILFKNTPILFCHYDNAQYATTITQHFSGKIIFIGDAPLCDAQVQFTSVEAQKNHCTITYLGKTFSFIVPFYDKASTNNIAMCLAVCMYLGLEQKMIEDRLKELRAVEMRMQILPGINNSIFINDSYSIDYNSLSIALSFLHTQPLNKTLIISDLYNGKEEDYKQIIALLSTQNIKKTIFIGPIWAKYYADLKQHFSDIYFFQSTAEFIQKFYTLHFHNEAILIKGSRHFKLELLTPLFQKEVHNTFLNVNLTAIIHNINTYKKQLLPSTKMMAMVKAFGYGVGSVEIASMLQYHKIDYLAVAYTDEAVELRKAGIHTPIMIMNIDQDAFEKIIEYHLEPEIFSFNILAAFTLFLKQKNIHHYPIHLKVDTGMHRLGFDPKDITELCHQLQRQSYVKIQSVFSHLVASEDAKEDDFTDLQFQRFTTFCQQLKTTLQYSFLKHIANTSAIHRHLDKQLDMVRIGIGLYGIDNVKNHQLPLQPAVSLYTTIAQIKHIPAGESIGYNRCGKVMQNSTIATIRIGYADGYRRDLGNGNGEVLIHQQVAKVVGNVCMDMTMVDITNIPQAKEGDIVEIFGENYPIEKVATACQTIPYEILTSIGNRVKRIYTEN